MNWQIVQEGKVSIRVPTGKISAELPVFYNPVMQKNREITLHVLAAWKREKLKIADPLAGSGIRGLRMKKELPAKKIKEIWMNDASPSACRNMKQNFKRNNLSIKNITICNAEANIFLREHKGFDYIDIDPFGSPNPFLDSAIQAINRGGILAVTATDTSALAGSHPAACKRKYWASPLRNELMQEIGARILIRKVQLIGSQYSRACIPIVSCASDHYTRIFFLCLKGKSKVDELLNQHHYLNFDAKTGAWWTTKMENLQKGVHVAGPLWIGQLWDAKFLKQTKGMFQLNKEAEQLVSLLREESKIPALGFYDLHRISRRHKINLRPMQEIQQRLKKAGYCSARTHFCLTALRSDAPLEKIRKAMR